MTSFLGVRSRALHGALCLSPQISLVPARRPGAASSPHLKGTRRVRAREPAEDRLRPVIPIPSGLFEFFRRTSMVRVVMSHSVCIREGPKAPLRQHQTLTLGFRYWIAELSRCINPESHRLIDVPESGHWHPLDPRESSAEAACVGSCVRSAPDGTLSSPCTGLLAGALCYTDIQYLSIVCLTM